MSAPDLVTRRREPSEFADELPRLSRMASLPADDPERAQLRDELITRFLPVGARIAGRHAGRGWGSREDLQQIAALAVVHAVDRWDPDRARGDFLGYLVPCVRGEVLRYFRDQSWSMRVPRRLKEFSVAVRRVTGPMTQELGRAPRPSELARRLGVDVEQILETLQAEENHHAATLDSRGPDDAPSEGERLGMPDDRLALVEDVHDLRPALARLPERERRIVLLRFYGDMSQSRIAEETGISQMHVSRLLSRTLARLRHDLSGEPPDPAGEV
ncbi:SigB/SigF/SigG family RNA polymerase sigma factor [Pseudonocardia ailaonensis]|uniref:SigB/SigF/SigG family RNA polymerase sigma factor n=1 Tax=Pseudonocardia ailaonensis TaxID=367279 RepID=A0ABN2N927_9PSEU